MKPEIGKCRNSQAKMIPKQGTRLFLKEHHQDSDLLAVIHVSEESLH
jgi:hypothetical protein